jgi:hypothetical protein
VRPHLSIVYPASSGTVGYSQDVALPAAAAEEEGAVYLRQLTDEELAGITVKGGLPSCDAVGNVFYPLDEEWR